ncbi:hypothetical protein M8J77_007550 [Diaphorina citri]|nr:hypothetical protein M8J77_007550 [Diaphorina citri]
MTKYPGVVPSPVVYRDKSVVRALHGYPDYPNTAVDITNVDFTVDITNVDFTVDITNVDFTVDITNVDFTVVDITNVDFTVVDITNVDLALDIIPL